MKARNEIDQQLLERKQHKISSLFLSTDQLQDNSENTLILSSSNDLGVIRNGGRRGSSLGPKAILNVLKNMTHHQSSKKISHAQIEKSNKDDNFDDNQIKAASSIKSLVDKFQESSLIHIGGGHDNIYPLLHALKEKKSIHVINIDAHLDTRTDSTFHSGTPFRQFDSVYQGKFRMTQIGIQNFSNQSDNFSNLKAEMKVISDKEVLDHFNKNTLNEFLEKNVIYNKDECTIFSLDCDAISSAEMKAVSAVNYGPGISLSCLNSIFEFHQKRYKAQLILGIYEFNPLHDDLSQSGSRGISSFIYRSIFK